MTETRLDANREGIQPMWEDGNNARGGKWQYSEKRVQVCVRVCL